MVKKSTKGSPNSSAAVIVNGMKPSEKMQVTGGLTLLIEITASLSFMRRSQNGGKRFLLMASDAKETSWVASWLESGGRPSGMVSNQKSGKPSRELGPRHFRKRLWLNSVLTKVI
ncbi:hypothetical protein D8674_035710 [Pyrus ussuriensis x Pyrus communis]|uniref:Uncharacterized protein n=1 Tax=Pyrus ussuriensis x Pyrus communis TaxID=2448454 RepID=A0A5N5GRM1_9ROSA|nr:hypothetical protein D8674_035710 [Pyrus ussuriensis x Pyrus communis]